MRKTRIKLKHDCFEGNYYVIQKRLFVFFWVDISDWISSYSKAEDAKKTIDDQVKIGVAI